MGWIFYQIYAPTLTPKETLLSKFFDRIDERFDAIENRVSEMDKKQEHHIQVTRAQARLTDGINHERVDEYLVKNGVDVGYFLDEDSDRDDEDEDGSDQIKWKM